MEMVTGDKKKLGGVDAKSVDYARLVAFLVESTKQQQKQIEAQQEELSRLRSLEARQVRQQAELEALRTLIAGLPEATKGDKIGLKPTQTR